MTLISRQLKQVRSLFILWLTIQPNLTSGQASSADSNSASLQSRSINLSATSPYQLRTGQELVLLGIGAVAGTASLVLEKRVAPLMAGEVRALDRANVNRFDRRATYQYSHVADRLSDVTLAGTVVLGSVLALGTRTMRHDFKTIAVLYAETLVLTNGLQRATKNLTQRIRPFVYNTQAPLNEKLVRDARQSFFSGHATNAFATAFFTGEVFRHYFPGSRLKSVVWGGSLALATTTVVLGYKGGRHYPSDMLAGMAFGSLAGWGIPKLHEVKNRSEFGRRLDVQPWSSGSVSGLYVRVRLGKASVVFP